jgi:hypothetical protein
MQMPNTHRTVYDATKAGCSATGNENCDPPPPPPPPYTAEQFFAQFLRSQRNMESMQQNMEAALHNVMDNTRHGLNQGRHEANQYSSFKDFMDTRLLIFKEAAEPLDVKEWINTMEDKFHVLRMTEVLKTKYAAQQLQGPAGMWWKHHHTMFPPNAHITWREFTDAFHGVYIPPGLTEMKLGEFLSLNQGTKTVTQYLHAFNNLSHYASDMVNTNAKKIASFKRGLNLKMIKHVGTNTRISFNDFVSDFLKQEKNNNVYATSKTRKRAFESGPSQPRARMANHSAYRLPAPGVRFRPPQRKNLNA